MSFVRSSLLRSILASCVVLLAPDPASAQATAIGLWEFDDDLTDSSGNGRNLFPVNPLEVPPFVAGVDESAVDVTGGVQSVPGSGLEILEAANSPSITSFNGVGLSVIAWLNPDIVDSMPIVSQDRSSSGLNDVGYGFNTTTSNNPSLFVRDTADRRLIVEGEHALATDQWTHVAVTWDGSSTGGVSIYVNGLQVSTSLIYTGFTSMGGASMPIRVGASHGDSGNNVNTFDGQIDHVSLWTGPLTPAEVLADYQNTLPLVPTVSMPAVLTVLMGLLALTGACAAVRH